MLIVLQPKPDVFPGYVGKMRAIVKLSELTNIYIRLTGQPAKTHTAARYIGSSLWQHSPATEGYKAIDTKIPPHERNTVMP